MEKEVYTLKIRFLHVYRNDDGETYPELAIAFLCPVDRHHKDSKAVIRSNSFVCFRTMMNFNILAFLKPFHYMANN